MSYAVRDLIAGAMRLCGAVDPGQALDAQEEIDALNAFNDMLDAWGAERLMLPFTTSLQFNTVPGQLSYSVGPGGDWSGVRPQAIKQVTCRQNGTDWPLTPLNYNEYAAIAIKATASPQPQSYYYEKQFPLGRFVLWPVPSAAVTVILAVDTLFSKVTLDTVLDTLPPGYNRALRYNLALELSPEYGSIKQEVASIAKQSKGIIKAANSEAMDAVADTLCPAYGHGRFNIYTGG